MCFVLGLCVVLYLVFVLAGPVIDREMYLLRATPHIWRKTGQALNQFDILRLVSMGAQPGPQPQDLLDHRTSAAPPFTHTIYLHTTRSARSSTYTIRRLSSPTAASATHLKPVGRELRAMLKFQFPRLNNAAICFRLAWDVFHCPG